MILELSRYRWPNTATGTSLYISTDLWLSSLKMELPVGVEYPAFNPDEHMQFMTSGLSEGEISALRSVTVVPAPGKIEVRNAALVDPVIWEGSLLPVCNGVYINAPSTFTALEPSTLYCVSPTPSRFNMNLHTMRRGFVTKDSPYEFLPGDLGFMVVYGENEQHAYEVKGGDVLTVNTDTVIAVLCERVKP